MKAFLRRLGAAYGSAIVLMFFSEYFFLNESPVLDLLDSLRSDPLLAASALFSLAGFYTLFTYPFLVVLSAFNVRTLSALLLAGALFGWATEGLLIPVVYEGVPVSFLFPSIGWHALIDVIAGWYFVRLGMRRLGIVGNGVMFIVLGALWGMWATWFWGGSETDALVPLSPTDFAIFAAVTSGFWLLGMVLTDWFGEVEFRVSKGEAGFVGLFYAVLVPATALPYFPLSMLIIPFVTLAILALWAGRNCSGGDEILKRLHTVRPPVWSYFTVFLMPLTAALVYPWFFANEVQVPAEDVVAVLLYGGLAWFVLAIVLPFVPRRSGKPT